MRKSPLKSFDTFDFTAIPSLNKPLTLELARCEYLIDQRLVLDTISLRTANLDARGAPRDYAK